SLGSAGGVGARFAHKLEFDRAAVEVELADEPGLEVAPIAFREPLLPVAEDPDAEGPVARLRGIVYPEPAGAYGGRRRALREPRPQIRREGGGGRGGVAVG